MISVPMSLVVTQWVVLFALGGLVIVMYRQLAHLLELSGSAHDPGGPDIGAQAPAFDYRHPSESAATNRLAPPGQGPIVLLFSDPWCGACDKALQAVETVTQRRPSSLRVLVVTDADDVAVAANDGLSRTPLEVAVVEGQVVTRDYGVTGTPLLLGVDANGVVQAKVSGSDEATVRRFLKELDRSRRKERGEKAPEISKPEKEEVRAE